jgi:hypothetical protein
MAARKSPDSNGSLIARIICMMFIWVFYVLFTLSCVSFSPSDPPAHTAVVFNDVPFQNWCGSVGAHLAYFAMQKVGPGVFVAIVLLGIALFLWTKGEEITQLPLRIIGGALLVAVVSTLFNMSGAAGPWGGEAGGLLGVALGSLLHLYFRHGAWFIVLATMVVGALLVADEIVLSLPAKLLWLGKRLPAAQVAGAAAGAAEGMWGGVRGLFDSADKGKKAEPKGRKKKDAPAEEADTDGVAGKNPKEDAAAKGLKEAEKADEAKVDRALAEPVAVVATPVAEEDEEADVAAAPAAKEPSEPVIRKPAHGAGAAVPPGAGAGAEAGSGQLPAAGPGPAGRAGADRHGRAGAAGAGEGEGAGGGAGVVQY